MTAGKTVTLRCMNGDGESVAFCSSCNEPICEQCADRRHADVRCRDCAYKTALHGVDEAQVGKRAAAQRVAIRSLKRQGKGRRVAGIVSACAVAVVLVVWSGPLALEAFAAEKSYAVGPVGEGTAPGLDECLSGLWKLRAAIDLYRYENKGEPPPNLGVLKKVEANCAGCDKPWRYRVAGITYRVACPSPGSHDRAAVFLDHRVGPPQIQLDRGKE